MLLIDSSTLNILKGIFLEVLRKNLSTEAMQWLQNKAELIAEEEKSVQLHLCFSHIPRITLKNQIEFAGSEPAQISELLPGFEINSWTVDRLARVWMLLQLPAVDRDVYVKKINSLFAAAEMNEQVALYSALPLYFYPENWVGRCEEGIRSNIGPVLEAIMYHNPYPERHLSEAAWNQLVLKAFFTDKEVSLILGLKRRANMALVATLKDYIQERLAAKRTVAPEIYELTQQMNQ